MPKTPAAVETTSIFALHKASFVGISIETWDNMELMISELNKLNELNPVTHTTVDDQDDHLTVAMFDEKVQELFHNYPFLEFSNQEPVPGNFYWEVQARISVWRETYPISGYTCSQRENQVTDCFLDFVKRYSSGTYNFLRRQRTQTVAEVEMLCTRALEEVSNFAHVLRHKQLSPSQKKDKKRLENWIASELKESSMKGVVDAKITSFPFRSFHDLK